MMTRRNNVAMRESNDHLLTHWSNLFGKMIISVIRRW